jgi:hypothetical protein
MKEPYVDRHIYTNWNALMISSFFEASYVLADDSIRTFGLKSLDRLMSLVFSADNGMYHFYDDSPHLLNQLADQMQTARTICHAYEISGDNKFLQQAEKIVEIASSKLYDGKHGGFFDMVVDTNAPGFLSKPAKPLDENSVAARVLLKLYHFTEKKDYYRMAEETLKSFVEIFPQFGFMAADYAMAVDALLNESTTIRIIGSTENPQTRRLLAEAHRIYEPRKLIQVLSPDKDSHQISMLGYPSADQPTAYVCFGKLCTAPITDPGQLAPEVTRITMRQLKR